MKLLKSSLVNSFILFTLFILFIFNPLNALASNFDLSGAMDAAFHEVFVVRLLKFVKENYFFLLFASICLPFGIAAYDHIILKYPLYISKFWVYTAAALTFALTTLKLFF
jgi:hypothetical protein